MFKTIYASLTGESGERSVLQTTLVVAQLFDGTADCVHVRLDAEKTIRRMSVRPFSTDILTSEQIKYLDREAGEHAEAARAAFESFRNAHLETVGRGREFPLRWQCVSGIDTDETIARSRLYDLLVIARDPESYSLGKERLGAIVMDCGRPVLLAPAEAPNSVGGTVLLAWKNCAEAARVATVASPFLAKASRIVIAHADEGSGKSEETSARQLAENLKRSGLPAETQALADDGRSAADRLQSCAAQIDADLIVMGAYGRSRLRELIFGGVTNSILDSCAIPVLLFH